jgi:hypothetical protein
MEMPEITVRVDDDTIDRVVASMFMSEGNTKIWGPSPKMGEMLDEALRAQMRLDAERCCREALREWPGIAAKIRVSIVDSRFEPMLTADVVERIKRKVKKIMSLS